MSNIQPIIHNLDQTQKYLSASLGNRKVTLVKNGGKFETIQTIWEHIGALLRALFTRNSSYFRGEQEAIKSLDEGVGVLTERYRFHWDKLKGSTHPTEFASRVLAMRAEEGTEVQGLKEVMRQLYELGDDILSHEKKEAVGGMAQVRFMDASNNIPALARNQVATALDHLSRVAEGLQSGREVICGPDTIRATFAYYTYRAVSRADSELDQMLFPTGNYEEADQKIVENLINFVDHFEQKLINGLEEPTPEGIEMGARDLVKMRQALKDEVARFKEWKKMAPEGAKTYLSDIKLFRLYGLQQRLDDLTKTYAVNLGKVGVQVAEKAKVAEGEYKQAALALESAKEQQQKWVHHLEEQIGEAIELQMEDEAAGLAVVATYADKPLIFDVTDAKRVELLNLVLNAPGRERRISQLAAELELDTPEKIELGGFLNHPDFKKVVDALFKKESVVPKVSRWARSQVEKQSSLRERKQKLDGAINEVLAGGEIFAVAPLGTGDRHGELLKKMQVTINQIYEGSWSWWSRPTAENIVDVNGLDESSPLVGPLSEMIGLRDLLLQQMDIEAELKQSGENGVAYGNFVGEMTKLRSGFEAAGTQKRTTDTLERATRGESEASGKLKAAQLLDEKVRAARQLLA